MKGDAGFERRQVLFGAMSEAYKETAREGFGESKPYRATYPGGRAIYWGLLPRTEQGIRITFSRLLRGSHTQPVKVEKQWPDGTWEQVYPKEDV